MSDDKRTDLLMEAYDPMWKATVESTILFHVPEDEQDKVMAILTVMRRAEIRNALALARKSGSPKQTNKFLQSVRDSAGKLGAYIKTLA